MDGRSRELERGPLALFIMDPFSGLEFRCLTLMLRSQGGCLRKQFACEFGAALRAKWGIAFPRAPALKSSHLCVYIVAFWGDVMGDGTRR